MSSKQKNIFITGASGFIGTRLSQCLAQKGHSLVCNYRRAVPPENLSKLSSHKVELFRFDLTDLDKPKDNTDIEPIETFREKISRADIVYHTAALTSDWGSRQLFECENVQITKSLLRESQDANVKRFVYISSLSVHGFGHHCNSSEEGPYYPLTHHYQKTKLRAEQLVLKAARSDFEVCVIRPGNVYGPHDTTMMFPLFFAMKKGIMGTIGGGKSLTAPVYIDDLITALIAAGSTPNISGEKINITGGEKINWRTFMNQAADALGVKHPKANIPSYLALPLAFLMTGIWGALGTKKAPPLTIYRVKQLINDYHFDISRAYSLLAYRPKMTCQEGLKFAAESFRKETSR